MSATKKSPLLYGQLLLGWGVYEFYKDNEPNNSLNCNAFSLVFKKIYIIFNFLIFVCICVCMYLSVCVNLCHMCASAHEGQKRVLNPLGPGVAGGFWPLDTDADE